MSLEWCKYLVEASAVKRETQLSSLRVKIKKHLESRAHDLAEDIIKMQKMKVLETAVEKQVMVSDKATNAIFCTAYFINQISPSVITVT